MLQFEREVVGALGSSRDPTTRAEVLTFVDASLRAMPQHIRAGVTIGSLALAAWTRLYQPSRRGTVDLSTRVHRWETSPLGPVQQYVRMFRSLVLFSENELAPDPTTPAGTS